MGFSYPTRFRAEACSRMLAGERVEELGGLVAHPGLGADLVTGRQKVDASTPDLLALSHGP